MVLSFFSDVPQAALACAINTPSILVSAESDFCVNLCVYEVNKLDVSWMMESKRNYFLSLITPTD